MKRFNIVTKHPKGSAGNFWAKVGKLTAFEPSEDYPQGGYALQLYMYPNTKFYLFPEDEEKPAK